MKNQDPPPKKTSAKARDLIPQKIREQNEGQTDDAYAKDMARFYENLRLKKEMRKNLEKPYFFLKPDDLRKKVDEKQRDLRKPSTPPSQLSDYNHTLKKANNKKKAKKDIAQLGQQSQQSIPQLVVGNQYGSNLGLVPDDYDLGQFFEDTGLSAYQLFNANAYIESAPEVDHW